MDLELDHPLARLQSLQRDLTTFTETRLVNLDRLSAELQASIDDFRNMLDKRKRNDQSRSMLTKPKDATKPNVVKIEDTEYEMTNEFKENAIMVSDTLDLDELESAKLCLTVQDDLGQVDDNLAFVACLRFHNHRRIMLDCLRIILSIATDADADDAFSEDFKSIARLIVQGKDNRPSEASAYWRKCIGALTEVEDGIRNIRDRHEKLRMTGENLIGPVAEALHGERLLLLQQHESLGAILTYLIQANYTMPEDFRTLLSKLSGIEAPMDIMAHYLPAIISASAHLASVESTHGRSEELHRLFVDGPGKLQWKSRGLEAVTTVCWLAEYSSRDQDLAGERERARAAEEREKLFFAVLKDRPLHFVLAICNYLNPEVWHDPAKVGLVHFLLDDQVDLFKDAEPASEYFMEITMQELQVFSDAFIANMPDILRRLKVQEDDKRRDMLSQPEAERELYEPHFERIMMVVAYAYENDADAAQDWWSDKEGNLYGFLRWASQRLPTPRVATFCELLRAIASDEKTANQAHKFLLEDTSMSAGKLRKAYAVSWAQIFSELEIFAQSVKDKPVAQSAPGTDSGSTDLTEPETAIMLEAYLRLASHMCRKSPESRSWILREQSFPLPDILLQLSQVGLEARLQACCLEVLSALLTDKVPEVNEGMWALLDNWISGRFTAATAEAARAQTKANRNPFTTNRYLQGVTSDPETAVAFVNLLNHLLLATENQGSTAPDILPFPEQLGSTSRHGGVEPYIDFVLGYIFPATLRPLDASAETTQVYLLQHACLQFIHIGLSSFNQDLVVLANSSNSTVGSALQTGSIATYIRLHPFARIMDFTFSDKVIKPLFAAVQKQVELLNNKHHDSPAVQTVLKALQVMNLVQSLQATYFDIVRPIVNAQVSTRPVPVANPALTSFDDVMVGQIGTAVTDITMLISCNHGDVSLQALELLQKLSASRKFASGKDSSTGLPHGNRLVAQLQDVSDNLVDELLSDFQVVEADLEAGAIPFKLARARALLDLLNGNLDASPDRPSIAHCLLGFACLERTVTVAENGKFSIARSLFHAIATAVVSIPSGIGGVATSWLIGLKRSAMEVMLKLAVSPLTANLVRPELEAFDFHAAVTQSQCPAGPDVYWDGFLSTNVEALLKTSALAIRDCIYFRQLCFDYSALMLRYAAERHALSLQEKITGTLLGDINLPTGEKVPALSVFDLFDFFDIETLPAAEAECKILTGLDFSPCVQDDPEIGRAFNPRMAEEVCNIRRRELIQSGSLRQAADEVQANDDTIAVIAALISQNNWVGIRMARMSAVESWTELVSLLMTRGGFSAVDQVNLALKGLQIVLPRFERSLLDDMDAAALLAKLVLSLVRAAGCSRGQEATVQANLTHERIVSAFRISMKAIVDSATGLALRDVCYRICCTILTSAEATTSNESSSQASKQYLRLVQTSSNRLLSVISEDAFSGRGVTRISSLLYLDALIALFQAHGSTQNTLRALSKLNFVPVLIDSSVGSIASSFADAKELATTLAYYHAAMNLILRICSTSDGTHLVLSSDFFGAVEDSRLFSTDPDIGLDIDNPAALKEFYKLLSAVLRIITAVVLVARGQANAQTIQQAKTFLRQNRFSIQAVFKRTSGSQKTAGPPEEEAMGVADEFGKLMLITGFLEDDEAAAVRTTRTNGFT